jgi:uncharacterized protein YjiS (DUF1127 family)
MRCEPDISICSPMSDQTIRSLQREEMEMVMSANLSAPTGVQGLARHFWRGRLIEALRRQGAAYQNWRTQQRAMARLRSMSDAQLKDIGLVRSQVEIAVRAGMGLEQRQLTHV